MWGGLDRAASRMNLCPCLEEVGVQALGVVVRPLDGPAHARRYSLNLHTYPLAVDTPLVPAGQHQSFGSGCD